MSDLIDRREAIDAATYGNPQTAWQRIEALPSAQPERKRGKWIIEPYHIDGDIYVHRCSICLKEAMLGSNKVRMNFCHHCGADMRGGKDE